MADYVIGTQNDKDEIVDFINYVFSQAKRPHDFKTLVPKSYADDAIDLGAVHYMAKENGKIKAVVAMRIIDVNVSGKILKYGLIGNVSVHPYSRGSGYMKKLMQMAIDDAKERGIHIMLLGGQRQRYGYFGFENVGQAMSFMISEDNIRHCFSDLDTSCITFKPMTDAEVSEAKALYEKSEVHTIRSREEFLNIMHTWNRECNVILKNGEFAGYIYGEFAEIKLVDESDFPLVLKAVFEKEKLDKVTIKTSLYEKQRSDFLDSICEESSIVQVEMINVLDWEKVLDAFLNLRAKTVDLVPGEVFADIDGSVYCIRVMGKTAEVKKCEDVSGHTEKMTHGKAERIFFSLKSFVYADTLFKNWLPLPLVIDSPDGY